MKTFTIPDARTQRVIDFFRDTSWRVNYLGETWPVRVFLAADVLKNETICATTFVLFDKHSQPAHRLSLEQAEAIAGLTNAVPLPQSCAMQPV